METLPRETIVDVLENRLREEILTGSHPAGSYLPPERELADGYGVTRTTLKHAFGRLVQSGLLETRHGVGTRVRDFARLGGADLLPMLVRHSPDWLGEIFEVRRSVGALIAERAAMKATPEQREELRALVCRRRYGRGRERRAARRHRGAPRARPRDRQPRLHPADQHPLQRLSADAGRTSWARSWIRPSRTRRLEPVVAAVGAGDAKAARERGGRVSDRNRADHARRSRDRLMGARGTTFTETMTGIGAPGRGGARPRPIRAGPGRARRIRCCCRTARPTAR